jgi:heme iron utilization protein
MNAEESVTIAHLLCTQRTAALGTLTDGAPYVSFVAYAAEADFTGFLLHLSRLSPHTRHIQADPRGSLLIAEPDDGRDDVQTLARITLIGTVYPIQPDAADYSAARTCYLNHLPAATMLFDFADFSLYRFMPSGARYIGGFARAFSLTAAQLRSLSD